MNNNRVMLENPLFTNRKRVLAVPEARKSPASRNFQMWLLNFALALIILFAFVFGISTGSQSDVLTGFIGQHWSELMQDKFNSQGAVLAEKTPWIMARVTGIVDYLLVFASVTLGLMVSMRLTDRFIHRANMIYLHKILSLLLLVFTVLHVVGLMLDKYIHISLLQSLTPFSTEYRAIGTGLGTISLYMMISLVFSFYLVKRTGYKAWRIIHYISFAAFVGCLVHGILAGSDTNTSWMQAIYLATGFIVATLTGMRFMSNPNKLPARN
ncbi:ferric reductase-like transmembrane domain-containing protein [Candidatus Chlorohelix sp.]|uniref:ferric reductase-like transmembrane domain-containing protein n=1 Tax=Candidatus Chlorohelix sp. TaxID=3139201 RepID=UPI003055C780